MARSSRRHRILDGFNGMVKNCKWLRIHAENIADLSMPEHPEFVDWCKAVYEWSGAVEKEVTDMKGKI